MKTLQLRAFTWSWRAPTGRPRGRSSPGTKGKSMGKLEGKIGLITGGTSGIGLATAKEFVNEGAYVFITGRRDPQLTAAVKEIGSTVTAVQGDVSNLGDLDRLFAQIKDRKSTRLNSSHSQISYAVFCLKKQKHSHYITHALR